ncbi:hypothetical protein AB0F46_42340 [Streptomyces sp. NPDC026665]|uniref:hypothetical protein n=1 Tax=Streptomyces sp. NPDC026665 TaxID=3154798 RepID=UPI0033E29A14
MNQNDQADRRWNYTPDSFTRKSSLQEQYISDMQIWDSTLFSGSGPEYNANTHAQQSLLRRHFLAMAYFGVNRIDSQSKEPTPLEIQNGSIPLAAIPSHGGRFAYETQGFQSGADGLARLQNALFTGESHTEQGIHKNQDAAQGREVNKDPGLFYRISTHGQKLERSENGRPPKWHEIKLKTGERGHIGMNFALGGINNTIHDGKGKPTRIGQDGYAFTQDGKSRYQLGSALFASRSDKATASARIMVGFEGTAPKQRNQLGASHGLRSTILGSILNISKYKNHRTLTGQAKGKEANIPSGLGAIGTTVTPAQLDGFLSLLKAVKFLEKDKHGGKEELHDHFRSLLSSTTAEQRHGVIRSIAASAATRSQNRNAIAQAYAASQVRHSESRHSTPAPVPQASAPNLEQQEVAAEALRMVQELGYRPDAFASLVNASSREPVAGGQGGINQSVAEVAAHRINSADDYTKTRDVPVKPVPYRHATQWSAGVSFRR